MSADIVEPKGPRASQLVAPPPAGDLDAQVIVVGAGPAGSSAATFLARCGLDVLLVDRAQFPRDKICGDGLTPRAVRMLTRLGLDTSPGNGWQRNLGLRVYGDRPEPFDMPWPELADFPDYGLVCPRLILDDILAGVAVEAGAQLLTGLKVEDWIFDGAGRVCGVRTADKRRLRAQVVVLATGNSARLATQLGIRRNQRRPMGVAVRAYYRSPLADSDWMISHLQLWDGKPGQSNLLPGYGWIFPAGNGVCNVGLGMLSSSPAFQKTNYRALMERWLASTDPNWHFDSQHQQCEIKGAGLAMAFNRKPHYKNGVLLVGDIGGMISPFNGEGIDYALEAGELAAQCIVEAFGRGIGTESGELALNRYASELGDRFGGYFRLGHVFAKLIGNPTIMSLCVKYGLPRKTLMRLVHKLLANLTDRYDGDWMDRLINALARMAPNA